jgi:hypothetical protein
MRIRRTYSSLFIIVAAVVSICFAFASPALAEGRGYDVKVMTRNMDAGTDFTLVAFAKSPNEFAAAVGSTIKEVLQSKIPARAIRLASEVAKAKPDVIALQEVTTWKIGSGRNAVKLDQLDLLKSS